VGESLFGSAFLPPVAVLRREALNHNLTTMADYCRREGVELAPHGKTTMCPRLWQAQLDAGAWGITVATVGQARVAAAHGVPRVLIANEVIDPAGVSWIAETAAGEGPELWCYVDSIEGVARLDAALARTGGGLDLLVEMGPSGGRSGVRTPEQAEQVATEVARTPRLRGRGLAGFEGVLGTERSAEIEVEVAGFLAAMVETARRLWDRGLIAGPGCVLSAGGSAFFDLVAQAFRNPGFPSLTLLRSGCYLSHDHGLYERTSPLAGTDHPLMGALEVWATVISTPEQGLAVADAGRRDLNPDGTPPTVISIWRPHHGVAAPGAVSALRLYDQHTVLTGDLGIGDRVGLGVSHPCLTFDRWAVLPVLDADHRVVEVVDTHF
jgi:D-serine deaminase-like pyridoxal phosphate-dependent protein